MNIPYKPRTQITPENTFVIQNKEHWDTLWYWMNPDKWGNPRESVKEKLNKFPLWQQLKK